MVYMLLPAGSAGHAAAMAMPGMSGPAAAGSNPAIALLLALFMLGYILWATDQLAALSPLRQATAGHWSGAASQAPAAAHQQAPVCEPPAPRSAAAHGRRVASAALAPRLAACSKIAMSAAMGYILMML